MRRHASPVCSQNHALKYPDASPPPQIYADLWAHSINLC